MSADTTKVYWAPFPFDDQDDQWNMGYRPPLPVADNFYSNLQEESTIVRCPATREAVKNLFSLNSNISDTINLDKDVMLSVYEDKQEGEYHIPLDGKISLVRTRPTSYKGLVNFSYNLSWLFLADEPLTMRTTPPIFPVSMPVENSFLAFGKYDIGKWFRPMNLDYHVPLDSKTFSVKENQPLMFLEFETDKKIEFVRFKNTRTIANLSREFSLSSGRWGKRMTLKQRYKMAENSKIIDLVMSEIKKNVVQP